MEKSETMTIKRNIQVPPTREEDKGSFRRITRCERCGRTAAHRDQFNCDPCPNCGGKVVFVEKGGIFLEAKGAWFVRKE